MGNHWNYQPGDEEPFAAGRWYAATILLLMLLGVLFG